MKTSDPAVQISCSGSQGAAGTAMPSVQPYLLETAGEFLDYVSVHNYWLNRAQVLRFSPVVVVKGFWLQV
jgi:hypothetical protein